MPTPTLQQLHRAIQIQEQIEKLKSELATVLGGEFTSSAAPARRGPKKGSKRIMSPEARERIAAAQRARWAKTKVKKEKPAKKKRKMSPEGRARIAAAQKKRWAAKKNA
jgi:hypothetical protein